MYCFVKAPNKSIELNWTEHTMIQGDLHLYATEDGSKKADHAEELDPAERLDSVLLAHVRDCIQAGTQQNQAIA